MNTGLRDTPAGANAHLWAGSVSRLRRSTQGAETVGRLAASPISRWSKVVEVPLDESQPPRRSSADLIAAAIAAVTDESAASFGQSIRNEMAHARDGLSLAAMNDLLTPPHVARFVAAALSELGPISVVDPYVVSPVTIAVVAQQPNVTRALGVVAGAETLDGVAALSVDALTLEYPSADGPLRFSGGPFDWAICSPPLGAKVWSRFTTDPGGSDGAVLSTRSRQDESAFGHGITVAHEQMGELLPLAVNADQIETGILVQLTERIFWSDQGKRWLDWFADRGLTPSAALSVSRGLSGAVIDTVLLALTRAEHKKLWVGRLEPTSDVTVLARNFVHRKAKGPIEFGTFVDPDAFHSWDAFRSSLKLDVWARRQSLTLTSLDDVAVEIGRFRADEDNEPPSISNTIFIDDRVVRKVSAAPFRPASDSSAPVPQHYVHLDPAVGSAEFLVSWFASEVGMASINSLAVGSGQKRVPASAMSEIKVPLVPVAEQEQFLEVQHRLQSVAQAASEALDELSNRPTKPRDILDEFDTSIEIDPLRGWMDRLPYPLAAILEVHLAESDRRERYERLLFFFEALLGFGADVLIAILRRDDELWSASRPKLIHEIDGRATNPLRRTEFGGLVHVCFNASKILRSTTHTENDPDVLRQITGVSDKGFVNGLTEAELWKACRAAGEVRNNFTRAHGGDIPQEVIEREMERLMGLIDIVRPITLEAFKRTEVLVPGSGRKQNGQRVYKDARRLMGPSNVFPSRPLYAQSLVDLEADRLVIVEQDTEIIADALELTGLVRLEEQPRGVKNVAFFYNRAEGHEHLYKCYQTDGLPPNSIFDPTLEAIISDIDP